MDARREELTMIFRFRCRQNVEFEISKWNIYKEIWPSCATFTSWGPITKYALESVSGGFITVLHASAHRPLAPAQWDTRTTRDAQPAHITLNTSPKFLDDYISIVNIPNLLYLLGKRFKRASYFWCNILQGQYNIVANFLRRGKQKICSSRHEKRNRSIVFRACDSIRLRRFDNAEQWPYATVTWIIIGVY